jgi:hypothetical protein
MAAASGSALGRAHRRRTPPPNSISPGVPIILIRARTRATRTTRFNPESIRVSNDGKSAFISDEYGPYVYQFDRATGQRINSFQLPANLYVGNLSPQGAVEISGNTSGRVANKGMEGLAMTPDGKRSSA